ncbi:hypothetical protein [Paracoccus cavernae]|uniref:hypothetical protein n=1 Tax=Paracoccus cavernae TaxID=1571207 RepID=UPI0035F43174
MASETDVAHSAPSWFVGPGETDSLAWIAIAVLFLAIFGLISLYAAFDRWAEHRSKGTPLAKTIPTMLTIALIYEVFPVDHFSLLLPLSAILISLMADWSRFHSLVDVRTFVTAAAAPTEAESASVAPNTKQVQSTTAAPEPRDSVSETAGTELQHVEATIAPAVPEKGN